MEEGLCLEGEDPGAFGRSSRKLWKPARRRQDFTPEQQDWPSHSTAEMPTSGLRELTAGEALRAGKVRRRTASVTFCFASVLLCLLMGEARDTDADPGKGPRLCRRAVPQPGTQH